MERFKNKLAIVVGATTTLGVAIAEELVNNGLKVLGLDTSIALLEKLALKLQYSNGTFQYYIVDLNKESEIINMISWTQENIGPIHIMIYNLTTCTQSNLVQEQTEDWRRIFEKNVISLNTITRKILKNMAENYVEGYIINISTILENRSRRNVYNIINESINTLTESFRGELRGSEPKIKITNLRLVTDINIIADIETNTASILKCRDIVNAVIFILSMSSNVQIDNLTLSIV
ncbi:short chain dehydrogenase [Popillia japonica]|uniref:Short chain dehydrogenase n=1 Tax=Popillia japonica TaxID=7064 RepID=A0AAW1ICX0_POPJA